MTVRCEEGEPGGCRDRAEQDGRLRGDSRWGRFALRCVSLWRVVPCATDASVGGGDARAWPLYRVERTGWSVCNDTFCRM